MLEAGRKFEIRPFGIEAQRLLRLEKRHVIVGVDSDALTNPFEAGMAWVPKLDKEDFIGRAALKRLAGQQPHQKLAGFIMNEDVLPEDGAAILVNGQLAGRVTSVRFSPLKQKAIGLAWMPADEGPRGSRSRCASGRTPGARQDHGADVLRSGRCTPANVKNLDL